MDRKTWSGLAGASPRRPSRRYDRFLSGALPKIDFGIEFAPLRIAVVDGDGGAGDGGGGVISTLVALDAPASNATASKNLLAFGFDRMVEGYASNTVQLKALTGDTTPRDFGIDPETGMFDMAAVNAWQPSADLDVVQFYDQMVTGKLLVSVGTTSFRRSGTVKRFGTTMDPTTAQLTRAALGGVAVDLGGNGHFVLAGTGTALSTLGAVEFHMLFSPNNRKIATNDSTDPLSGSSTLEWLLTYGNSTNQRMHFQMGGAAAMGSSRIQTSATDLVNANFVLTTAGAGRWKQFSQNVISFVATTTAMQSYGFGRRIQSTAMSANNQTAVSSGTLDNATLVIGANFSGSGSNAQATTSRANMLFGGAIITAGLTEAERTTLQDKFAAVGQQHRVKSVADIMNYMDEWVFMKDVDANGLVAGRKGLLSLQFNKGASGSDWNFAYAIPNVGVQGIRSPTANASNKFAATSSYFAGVHTGTVLSIHHNEQTNNSLQFVWAREDPSYTSVNLNQRGNLGIGYDHNCPNLESKWGIAKDTETLFTGRWKVDGSAPSGFAAWGAAIYEANGGGANQSMGKYNVNTSHNSFAYNETITDGGTWTLTKTWWETGVDASNPSTTPPYALDAPVVNPVPENMTSTFRQDCLMMQIATFEAPEGYNPADSYAVRKTKRLMGKNRSYVFAGSSALGHFDGSYARNDNAGVADGNANDIIQSCTFQQAFNGTRVVMAFKANGVLTTEQSEEIATNKYKLLAA